MVFIILQWNARSLSANGQEFKKYVESLKEKPNIICVQETWLVPRLDFLIKGYNSLRRDREVGKGGGVVIFIQRGIQYKEIKKGNELEYIAIEVRSSEDKMIIINYYNPCRQVEVKQLEDIWKDLTGRIIWCGDFNAHSTLWGEKDDVNGNVIEEFMEEKELVCLNDGSGTRIDVARGTESVIDLTIVTKNIAGKCDWEVLNESTVGSDHYPIRIQIGVEVGIEHGVREERWILEKADWDKYREVSNKFIQSVDKNQGIEELCCKISSGIIIAAGVSIPKTKLRH